MVPPDRASVPLGSSLQTGVCESTDTPSGMAVLSAEHPLHTLTKVDTLSCCRTKRTRASAYGNLLRTVTTNNAIAVAEEDS